jgi:hypothetical protein
MYNPSMEHRHMNSIDTRFIGMDHHSAMRSLVDQRTMSIDQRPISLVDNRPRARSNHSSAWDHFYR